MALAEDDPYVEQLIEAASTRKTAPLSRRELRTDAGLGALLLVAVVALALLAPSARALSPLGAIALDRRLRPDPAGPVRRRPRLHGPQPARVHADAAARSAGTRPAARRGQLPRRPPSELSARRRPPDAPGLRPRRRRLRRRARGGRGAARSGPHRPRRLARAGPRPRRPGGLRRRRDDRCATSSPTASRRRSRCASSCGSSPSTPRSRRWASSPGSPASASRSPSPSSCPSWACSPSSPASAARASRTRWRCRTPTAGPRC